MLKRNEVRIKLINMYYFYERYRSTIIDVDVVWKDREGINISKIIMKINKNNIALLNILIVVSTVSTCHFVKFVSSYSECYKI